MNDINFEYLNFQSKNLFISQFIQAYNVKI
jgi:hypothetical protein